MDGLSHEAIGMMGNMKMEKNMKMLGCNGWFESRGNQNDGKHENEKNHEDARLQWMA
jgi:hypothetical protein